MSAFSYRDILQQFKDACPGVRSVVFCDGEGETIDFVSDFDSYHTQLLGAYQSDVLHRLRSQMTDTGRPSVVELRSQDALVRIWPITTGYYVVALAKRGTLLPPPLIDAVTRTLSAHV